MKHPVWEHPTVVKVNVISGICLFWFLESNENVKSPGRKIYQAFQNVGYNVKTFSMKGKNCPAEDSGKK